MKNKQSTKEPRIVEYLTKDSVFTYSNFWKGRDYDKHAEHVLLRKYFKKYLQSIPNNAWLTDIGGNYGRLLPVYATRFKEVAILDYAYNEFHIAQKTAEQEDVKLHLVRANAYHIPLADDSQPYLIAVRLLHHLEDPGLFFQEMSRILKPGGLFILEAANKNNFKTLLKALFTFKWQLWRSNYYNIGSHGIQADGSFTLIRNYKASYIEKIITEQDLTIICKRSISWFRSKLGRRFTLISNPLERLMQLISWLVPLGPSNWYVITKPQSSNQYIKYNNFLSTLYNQNTQKPVTVQTRSKFKQITDHQARYFDLLYVPRQK